MNKHSPCKVNEDLPMVLDSTHGAKPHYKLICKCGAVEIYGMVDGITANTNRCYRCCGLAFGLRIREYFNEEKKNGN